jgi:dTDP-4-amino-4,6-dideoxy-D-galactose acyltransferase
MPWDTEFFGFKIARAHVSAAESLDAEIAAARAAGVACLYIVVTGAESRALEGAIGAGALLTALRVVQGRDGDGTLAQGSGVRRATPGDAGRVVDLSRSLVRSSRFANDPRFPHERIEEMYRLWALNDLRDGDVFVGIDAGGGMVTMSSRPDAAAIGLVYAEPRARGTGLGRALLTAAVAAAADRHLTVATDARNVPALRLYESLGFRSESFDAILHLWLDGSRVS